MDQENGVTNVLIDVSVATEVKRNCKSVENFWADGQSELLMGRQALDA